MIIIQLTADELATTIEQAVSKALQIHQPKQEESGPTILSIEQAADLLNLSKHTLYGLTSKGCIPYSKRGKRLYFQREELLAWIKEGRRKTQTEIAAEAATFVSPKHRAA